MPSPGETYSDTGTLSPNRIGTQFFFPERGICLWLLLLLLFTTAAAARLYNVESPPLDFHEVRQYHSLLIARSFYYESSGSFTDTDKNIALAARPPLLEPPVIEYTASLLYRLFGGEIIMIPRIMSILFWLVSAVFLYLIARDLVSPDAAVIAVSFFLFLPYSIWASRSFQPDPLMIMMFLAAGYSICRYYSRPTKLSLAVTCTLSAITIFIKPVCLFPVFCAFVAMRISMRDIRKIFFGRDMVIFAVASVLPTILYSAYGYYVAGFLKGQVGGRLDPGLYLEPSFWIGWFRLAFRVIGKWPLIISLAGLLVLRPGKGRAFLMGLWAGYVIIGLVFNDNIYTHDYYHLILIPVVALSLGAAATVLLNRLASNEGVWRLGAWLLLVFSILLSVRSSLTLLSDTGFDARIYLDKRIGELVKHSTNTVYLDTNYGNRLRYYGKFAGTSWPTSYDFEFWDPDERGKERLEGIIEAKSPEYFIVSSPEELVGQEDLKKILDDEYDIVAETPDYIIYNLK